MDSSSTSGTTSTTNPLLKAASTGNLNLLKKLVRELGNGEAVMDIKDSHDMTALHHAAAGGKTHVCNYLIEQLKFDVNVKDDKGDTPLQVAVYEEQYAASAYLLNHGAETNVTNHKGLTVLHYAAQKGRKDLLCLLISKGAKVDAQSFKGTPLHCAAAHGMKHAVKILLDNHANPNSVSHDVYSPLVAAILAKSVDCVRLLLKAGADPNIGSAGVRPLIVAASEGETEMIKCLLKAGADPNVTNFFGLTPIQMAAMNGNHADVMALFHVTTPIPSIPHWNLHGLLDYVNSTEAKNQLKIKVEVKFHEAKEKGAEAVKRKDYHNAIYWYTEAINAKPMDASVLSNRSLCWARLNEGDNALEDARSCIALREDWPKAYYRAGMAWRILRNYEKAVDAFEMGLMRDPMNKELQEAFNEALADLNATGMSNSTGPTNFICSFYKRG